MVRIRLKKNIDGKMCEETVELPGEMTVIQMLDILSCARGTVTGGSVNRCNVRVNTCKNRDPEDVSLNIRPEERTVEILNQPRLEMMTESNQDGKIKDCINHMMEPSMGSKIFKMSENYTP